MPDINVPLLRKTLEHITAHPEEWNQDVWAKRTECGTACCLAGTALAIQGYEFDWDNNGPLMSLLGESFWLTDGRGIDEAAIEELGLTNDEADRLFDGDNSLHTLWSLAEDFTDGEIAIPETL